MKHLSLGFLVFAFILMSGVQPASVFADNDGDDDTEYRYDDEDDDDDDDEDEDEDEDDDSNDDDDSSGDDELEVEADVFTDVTIVKVELENGAKYTFSTDADTEEEVAEVVANKFDLSEEEVLAALDFEVEDRASRTGERIKTKDYMKNKVKDRIKECRATSDDSSDELEVEADVFTDTTIVKVELASGTKKVFDTDATTSADIIAEVAERFDLDADDVEAVFDLEVEDRASRPADRAIAHNSADCDDDNSNVSGPKGTSNDTELRARIAELQRMLETLIRLFTLRFGNTQ